MVNDNADKLVRDNFWERPLEQLTRTEWEQLCDGCARCCLKKLQDDDTPADATKQTAPAIRFTRVVCRYLNQSRCSCKAYQDRQIKVPDCLVLDMENLPQSLYWIPDTCAYKLRYLDKPLPQWHPLLTGSRSAMEELGIPVTGRVLSEQYVHDDGLEEHVIRWVKA
ncbi:MAG: YcgN family cysteine cluster protein [Pseudohongiella sp.]|nr:YcgN family cysteine cluster protein [Pseudohongiella sp.]